MWLSNHFYKRSEGRGERLGRQCRELAATPDSGPELQQEGMVLGDTSGVLSKGSLLQRGQTRDLGHIHLVLIPQMYSVQEL